MISSSWYNYSDITSESFFFIFEDADLFLIIIIAAAQNVTVSCIVYASAGGKEKW